jgi:hypothetical protein
VKNSLFAAAALSVLSISAAAHAEVVAGYDFTGYTGNEPAGTVTAFDPNVTVSDAVRGAGFESPGTLAGDPRDVNAIGVYPLDTNVYYDTVDDNTSASEYLTFSLTPTAGSSMSLTQLVFTGDIQNGAGTIPDSLGMSYSTDGMDFTTAAGTITGGTGAQGSALIGTFPVVIADDTQQFRDWRIRPARLFSDHEHHGSAIRHRSRRHRHRDSRAGGARPSFHRGNRADSSASACLKF